MKALYKPLIALGLLGASLPAGAAVLTFDDLATSGSDYGYINGPAYTYQGYVFTSTYGANPAFIVHNQNTPGNADPGGGAFSHRWDRNFMNITREDGGLFDLTSMDVADFFNTGAQFENLLLFEYADGRIEQIGYRTDNQAGLETILFNRTGLKRFGFAAAPANWWQIDNLTITETAPPVPEPASWAMMIAGSFAVGASLRRRGLAALAA